MPESAVAVGPSPPQQESSCNEIAAGCRTADDTFMLGLSAALEPQRREPILDTVLPDNMCKHEKRPSGKLLEGHRIPRH